MYTVHINRNVIKLHCKHEAEILTVIGVYPAIEDIMIIEGDLLSLRSGKDSFIRRKLLLTFISKILSHTSSEVSKIVDALGLLAAFDTRISKPPNSSFVYSIINVDKLFHFVKNNTYTTIRSILTF